MKEANSSWSNTAYLPDSAAAEPLIASVEQIPLLLSRDYLLILKAVSQTPLTIQTMTERLGLDMGTVYYRTRRLLDHGLLQVVTEQRRTGRPQKYYGLCHRRYKVRFKDTDSATADDLLVGQALAQQKMFNDQMLRNLRESIAADEDTHVGVSIFEGKIDMSMNIKEQDSVDSLVVRWLPVMMDVADSRALERDILELIERYAQRAAPERRQHHLVGFQLVRTIPDEAQD